MYNHAPGAFMLTYFSVDVYQHAFEIVCCFFTLLGAFASYLLTMRF